MVHIQLWGSVKQKNRCFLVKCCKKHYVFSDATASRIAYPIKYPWPKKILQTGREGEMRAARVVQIISSASTRRNSRAKIGLAACTRADCLKPGAEHIFTYLLQPTPQPLSTSGSSTKPLQSLTYAIDHVRDIARDLRLGRHRFRYFVGPTFCGWLNRCRQGYSVAPT